MEAWLSWLVIILLALAGFILAFLLLNSLFPNAFDLSLGLFNTPASTP